MDKKYLGDSYDLVKRFFAQELCSIARLYADPWFIPKDIQADFGRITGIKMSTEVSDGSTFGLLLDPDTGILAPGRSGGDRGKKHISLRQIIGYFQSSPRPQYLVCFDQSHHRKKGNPPQQQRMCKMTFLSNNGLRSFYYKSHAPFLFVARDLETLRSIRKRLLSAGIPACKIESCEPG